MDVYVNQILNGHLVLNADFMKHEVARLLTFASWCGKVSVIKLAKAGFYYTGMDDVVECFCCHNRKALRPSHYGRLLYDFSSFHLHSCRFQQQQDRSNVPLYEEVATADPIVNSDNCHLGNPLKTGNVLWFHKGYNSGDEKPEPSSKIHHMCPCRECGVTHETGDSFSQEQTEYGPVPKLTTAGYQRIMQRNVYNGPLHPKYWTIGARKETYHQWDKVTSAKMAAAGFYCIGVNDSVRCYYCGGGLQNWHPTNDPWQEHARWFPRCWFLRDKMGDEYIHGVLQMQGKEVKAKGGICFLRMEVVQAVLEFGVSSDVIQTAILEYFKDNGGFPATSATLMEYIMTLGTYE